MDKKKISIIVTFSNTKDLLANFFDNIIPIITKYDYELILYQDGVISLLTADLIKSRTSTIKNIKVYYNSKTRGYSIANNLAVKQSSNEILVFLNTDVLLESDAIEKLTLFLQKEEKYRLIQGLLIYPQDGTVQTTGHIFSNHVNSHALSKMDITSEVVQTTSPRQGCCSAFYTVERTDFELINGFNEEFFNAWDGLEFSLRLGEHYGNECTCMYYHKAVGYHSQNGTRNKTYRNELYQSLQFWNDWYPKIRIDYHKLILKQIDLYLLNEECQFINCSSYPIKHWNNVTDNFLNTKSIFNIQYLEGKKIVLEQTIDFDLITKNIRNIFLVNSFKDIIDNKYFFTYRKKFDDIIIDLHGVVIKATTFYGQ